MNEIWLPIPVQELFGVAEVSNIGNIRTLPRKYQGVTPNGFISTRKTNGKLLNQRISNKYKRVSISVNGNIKSYLVHRLVALAFIPNPKNLPQINHIDGVKINNHLENLEWCTPSQNTVHAMKNGLIKIIRGHNRAFAKLDDNKVREIRELIKLGVPYIEISKKFNICKSKITFIKQGKSWSHVV